MSNDCSKSKFADLSIPYEVRDTEFGKGLFALADVKAGELVWEYRSVLSKKSGRSVNVIEYDQAATVKHLAALTHEEAVHFMDMTYGKGELLAQPLDDGMFMNHADPPNENCKTDMTSGDTFAIKDILAGSQLFEDYTTFSHPDYLYDLLEQYNCSPSYYQLPEHPTSPGKTSSKGASPVAD